MAKLFTITIHSQVGDSRIKVNVKFPRQVELMGNEVEKFTDKNRYGWCDIDGARIPCLKNSKHFFIPGFTINGWGSSPFFKDGDPNLSILRVVGADSEEGADIYFYCQTCSRNTILLWRKAVTELLGSWLQGDEIMDAGINEYHDSEGNVIMEGLI